MPADIFFPDRLKSTRPDMKGNKGIADPFSAQFFKNSGGEMKASGRSSRRAVLGSVNGLVLPRIFQLLLDIRGQGDLPDKG